MAEGSRQSRSTTAGLASMPHSTNYVYRNQMDISSADKLMKAEMTFQRACEQIIHLNRRLDDMSKRYEKASKENHRSFRYSLRLRMAVTEGVRNMYYEYAASKADEISAMRSQLHNDSVNDENRYDGENAGHDVGLNVSMDTDAASVSDSDTSSASSDDTGYEPMPVHDFGAVNIEEEEDSFESLETVDI